MKELKNKIINVFTKSYNNLFKKEREMQKWLSDELHKVEGILDLVVNEKEFKLYKPINISEVKIYDSFQYCMKSMYLNNLITEDENISLKKGDSLKPDFLLYAPETESIVIVELKNLGGPSRQVGTELLAYAGEIKTYVQFISDGDIINVIISPVWPTLLRHYIFHEIFWLQKKIICLKPVSINDETKLEILNVNDIIEDNVNIKISEKHLGGYQLCLYDENLYKDPNNTTRLDPYIKQMESALSAIATKGYSHKNHGFAFLWKDCWNLSLAPYSITILNFAPFQTLERFFHDEEFIVNDMTEKFINIIEEHNPQGHSETLIDITKAGNDLLSMFCKPRMEGFHTWDVLKSIMEERSELVAFKSWGVFDELYSKKLMEEYKKGNLNINNTDPIIGLKMLNELIDPNYEFIDLKYYNYDPDKDS